MKRKLVLFSTSFLWTKAGEGLLYNTDSGKSLHFHISDRSFEDVCIQWYNLDNLYAARFDDEVVSQAFLSFVEQVCGGGFGVVAEEEARAFALPPVLKVKHGVDESSSIWKGEEQPTLIYLKRVQLFLGGAGDGRDWWRQVVYPITTSEKLDAKRLMPLLKGCDRLALMHLDLVISDWDASQVAGFAEGLSELKDRVHFFFAHPDPGFRNDILDDLVSKGYAVTQLCPPDSALRHAAWVPGRSYHLLLRGEEEYNHWEALLKEDAPDNYKYKLVAGDNIDFFRGNVFLSEEEILGQKLSKKDIFRHQVLNVNQFGTFYVFPDGTVHPAADAPAIGTLEDSVHSLIIRELEENHAWRRTRRLMTPCKDCLYHDLCPSPSAYERVLGVPGCTLS